LISEIELAWLAGFIDGEGCISIHRRFLKRRATPEYTIVLEVSNTKRNAILFLKDLCGGCVKSYKPEGKTKVAYKWQAKAKVAKDILEPLFPYLRLKQEQAQLALELTWRLKPHGYNQELPEHEIEERETLYQKMKVLNRRGQGEGGLQIKLVREKS